MEEKNKNNIYSWTFIYKKITLIITEGTSLNLSLPWSRAVSAEVTVSSLLTDWRQTTLLNVLDFSGVQYCWPRDIQTISLRRGLVSRKMLSGTCIHASLSGKWAFDTALTSTIPEGTTLAWVRALSVCRQRYTTKMPWTEALPRHMWHVPTVLPYTSTFVTKTMQW